MEGAWGKLLRSVPGQQARRWKASPEMEHRNCPRNQHGDSWPIFTVSTEHPDPAPHKRQGGKKWKDWSSDAPDAKRLNRPELFSLERPWKSILSVLEKAVGVSDSLFMIRARSIGISGLTHSRADLLVTVPKWGVCKSSSNTLQTFPSRAELKQVQPQQKCCSKGFKFKSDPAQSDAAEKHNKGNPYFSPAHKARSEK